VTDVIALAQELVRMDTAGVGEQVAAEHIGRILARAGADVELVPYAPGRAHLLASAGDTRDAPLVLSGHLDTVPPGDAPWAIDPLGGELRDGFLTGRGSADMKSGVAALVTACVRRLSRGTPSRGIQLVLTAAEETGCEGSRHLVSVRSMPTGGPLLVAEPTDCRIATGHKGVLWLQIRAEGRSAHGSRPDLGLNAIVPLARLVTALHDHGLPGDHAVMGSVTVNVGMITGGTRMNVVPDSATMAVDIRTVPGSDTEELIARIRELSGADLLIEVVEDLRPVYSSPEAPLARSVTAALESVTGSAPSSPPLTYFTDAAILAGALSCSETVLMGPGDPAAAHSSDERCALEQIERATDVYEAVLDSWC
jgi:succinyl-diaminopimelate desuccinylase